MHGAVVSTPSSLYTDPFIDPEIIIFSALRRSYWHETWVTCGARIRTGPLMRDSEVKTRDRKPVPEGRL